MSKRRTRKLIRPEERKLGNHACEDYVSLFQQIEPDLRQYYQYRCSMCGASFGRQAKKEELDYYKRSHSGSTPPRWTLKSMRIDALGLSNSGLAERILGEILIQEGLWKINEKDMPF